MDTNYLIWSGKQKKTKAQKDNYQIVAEPYI